MGETRITEFIREREKKRKGKPEVLLPCLPTATSRRRRWRPPPRDRGSRRRRRPCTPTGSARALPRPRARWCVARPPETARRATTAAAGRALPRARLVAFISGTARSSTGCPPGGGSLRRKPRPPTEVLCWMYRWWNFVAFAHHLFVPMSEWRLHFCFFFFLFASFARVNSEKSVDPASASMKLRPNQCQFHP